MNLLILSDLHNEFETFVPVSTDADVVIQAAYASNLEHLR